MKKNILLRTNLMVCVIIVIGFCLTAVLSYQANFDTSLQSVEQVSSLTSEGIYYQLTTTFTKPVNISLTMANDSLLRDLLSSEATYLEDEDYIGRLRKYLGNYQEKYSYDSVFLVSTATGRYYNFRGLDRVLTRDNPENVWYYELLDSDADYAMNVDNDEAANNEITVFVNCKIKSDAGTTLGIVGVGLRIDYLQSLLHEYEREFGVQTYLIDDTGKIEISTQYSGYEQENLFELNAFSSDVKHRILDWTVGESACSFWTSEGDTAGLSSYMVARYLPELSWHLVVERNIGPLMEELYRQLFQTVLIIIAIIGIILVVITYVIRGFNKKIMEMNEKQKEIFRQTTEQMYDNIYELNITQNQAAGKSTKRYFESLGMPGDIPYDQALLGIAKKQIKEEFREGYISTFAPENVLREYEKGNTHLRYDFMIRLDGEDYFWLRIDAHTYFWPEDGCIHMFTYRKNIDKEKKQAFEMTELAQKDEMTGLYTKMATARRINRLLEQSSTGRYAFFIFDIDNFKQANDSHGHAFGDSVIVTFVDTIKRYFHEEAVIGRIGGDEFVAFTLIADRQQADEIGRKLSAALHMQHVVGQMSWSISASIGVAISPENGTTFELLYKCADTALYQTKKRGKNGYTIYPSARPGKDN
ncbi:sensor domain-containing diguanylate cyclase [Clostridium sp. D33t1_170424_F3]|uniref:sensor domain-containing diguanylate cyclase n=1 Tax=Clostridium sp. D33t1_170424_F3 TaxID=2787099 RepID=UPI0018AAB07B|nr:sensor domain-containing diguanylate cyclase [Clostridium sp. D33t1_170424_F3]